MFKNRKNILVLADLGGCPPHYFYENIAQNYNIVSYIPRPFAITKDHFDLINKYSIAVIQEESYFENISSFTKTNDVYWAMDEHNFSLEEVVNKLIELSKMFNIQAITTNNELFVEPVAVASKKLDLKGAGSKGAKNARDKFLMRQCFNNSKARTVNCKKVDDLNDLIIASKELGFPFILKPTYLASSLGVTLFKDSSELEQKFNELKKFVDTLTVPKSVKPSCIFIAEEYLVGNSSEWYGVEGYGDYVSIEGIMKDGQYYPIAITDKSPQIGFTETSHISTSVLSADKQKLIIEAAKYANESLDLENCATHTEMKLLPNLEVGLIETAARYGGWNIIPNTSKVLDINYPKLLIDVLTSNVSDQYLENIIAKKPKKFISDFHIYLKDGENVNTDIIFEGLEDTSQYINQDVKVNKYDEIPKKTILKYEDFTAFNSVAFYELESANSNSLVQTINNIRKNINFK
ncbi:ATP-grasp domain-containing protein [Staphylococcus ursi]|uniref:ATP-grasp domain-containing protein n=1 Tax=Staphylococcus sp. MI 10-1553 TaxID=1912064 RepID=UPI0013988D69|nr:ATP-grasp domain-containing protein [Staphylococcus sp. MI 10-1553]QHW36747.1 ATP-grasp domain-containing protein [Staphylococcus sp. MI 10-1553]